MLQSPILFAFVLLVLLDGLAVFVTNNDFLILDKVARFGNLPHGGIGKGVAVKGFEWLVGKLSLVAVNLHWAVVVRAVVLPRFDAHFRRNALDAKAVANGLNQKSW